MLTTNKELCYQHRWRTGLEKTVTACRTKLRVLKQRWTNVYIVLTARIINGDRFWKKSQLGEVLGTKVELYPANQSTLAAHVKLFVTFLGIKQFRRIGFRFVCTGFYDENTLSNEVKLERIKDKSIYVEWNFPLLSTYTSSFSIGLLIQCQRWFPYYVILKKELCT